MGCEWQKEGIRADSGPTWSSKEPGPRECGLDLPLEGLHYAIAFRVSKVF